MASKNNMSGYYILNGITPVKCNDYDLFLASTRDLKDVIVSRSQNDDVLVSTVFLGIAHSYENRKPVLFETKVFGGECDELVERYTDWNEAVEGHNRIAALVLNQKN